MPAGLVVTYIFILHVVGGFALDVSRSQATAIHTIYRCEPGNESIEEAKNGRIGAMMALLYDKWWWKGNTKKPPNGRCRSVAENHKQGKKSYIWNPPR